MSELASVQWFAEKLSDRTMRGIAIETSALIRAGAIPVGTKLPAIRDLAYTLGISPATVSEAWSELRRQKIITGRGRNGTWVSGDRIAPRPLRLASSGDYGDGVLNLAIATPDVDLLPPLENALKHGATAEALNSYQRVPILPELQAAVERDWPCKPEAFLATNGGYNAVYALLHALVMPGSFVAIEEPTALRLLDILEDLGAHILPVACDENGPLPDALALVLKRKPAAFLFQPRTHAVTGRGVSRERFAALGDVLADSDALIIEDDGVGDISSLPPISLGDRFPDRVIHIVSYSKSLGPDLRLAVLSSSARIVEQIQSYRLFSSGWTSRVLQSAVAFLIKDAATQLSLQRAKGIYRERRNGLMQALRERGVHLSGGEGFSLWVPVASEQFALVTLAARGIAVGIGRKYVVNPSPHIRVATSILRERQDDVADAIALAVRHPDHLY
jgi:DNA-binding transcriptional MocR family regulator